MPTPLTPLAKASLTGADKKDPQRFRNRSEPNSSGDPVGDPPSYLKRDAKSVWREAAKNLGWLEKEDRHNLEAFAVAMGQMRELSKLGEFVPASLLAAINTALGKLGASPTDRGKVFQKPDEGDDDDPFAAFGKPN